MGFFSSGLQANPRDPASRTVLILAGGFSDPSTWARGRLKSTFRGAWSATALSFPKTALPRAACPMSHAAAPQPQERTRPRSRYRQDPGAARTGGRARLEVRAALLLAPSVMLGLHRAVSVARRSGARDEDSIAAGSRLQSRTAGPPPTQTGNQIVLLTGSTQIPSPSGCGRGSTASRYRMAPHALLCT